LRHAAKLELGPCGRSIADAIETGRCSTLLCSVPLVATSSCEGYLVRMSTAYQHQPLSSNSAFRLLILQPARNRTDPLQCSILESNLHAVASSRHTLKYEALSYAWGADPGLYSVLCHDRTLCITSSCDSALRHLRNTTRQRTLFVDAICIDQSFEGDSVSERNHQVKLMGQIYSQASRVLIWLGEGNARTADIFRRLEQLNVQLRQRTNPKSFHGWISWKMSGSLGSYPRHSSRAPRTC
jgi:hypothetical protein